MKTGEKIQELRKKKKITQKELGELLGVSQQMIGQYENCSRIPKLDTLKKIAEALEVPYTYLLDEIDMDAVEKSISSFADEIKTKRGILNIERKMRKLGFLLSVTMDENACESSLVVDGTRFTITDDELKAIDKDSDEYLKFKIIELLHKKSGQ